MARKLLLVVLVVALLALFAAPAGAQTDGAKKAAGLLDKVTAGGATKALNATTSAVNKTSKAVGQPIAIPGITAPAPAPAAAKSSAAAVAAGALAGAGALAVLMF